MAPVVCVAVGVIDTVVVASVVVGCAGSRSRVGIVVSYLCGPIWRKSVREAAFREPAVGRRDRRRLDCSKT